MQIKGEGINGPVAPSFGTVFVTMVDLEGGMMAQGMMDRVV